VTFGKALKLYRLWHETGQTRRQWNFTKFPASTTFHKTFSKGARGRMVKIVWLTFKKFVILVFYLCFNAFFSGNKKGEITLHDDSSENSSVLKCMSGHHLKEVCGLRLAPGTSYLASGGDDGHVNIWDLRMMKSCRNIKAHTACVKVYLTILVILYKTSYQSY
jgi:WD40 repeat protein